MSQTSIIFLDRRTYRTGDIVQCFMGREKPSWMPGAVINFTRHGKVIVEVDQPELLGRIDR